jgi:hypothetical protein
MPQRRALDLIASLAKQEESLRGQRFVSPLLPNARARLRVAGIVYELRLPDAQAGWWICQIDGPGRASIVEEAQAWQRAEYLEQWPSLRCVLIEQVSAASWLALPFNPSDAAQRFGRIGPQIVHLVEQGQPFERIVARVEGQTLWYDEIDRRADPTIGEQLRRALYAEQPDPQIAAMAASERAAYVLRFERIAQRQRQQAVAQLEGRLLHTLRIAGADLVGYSIDGEQVRVTWERDGLRSTNLIDLDFNLISAGICLSGEDQRFDLASIVSVVREAPDYARWGEEEL